MATIDDFGRLAVELYRAPTIGETVEALVAYAVQAIGCDFATVMHARRGKGVHGSVATDPLVAELDQLQLEFGQGPSLAVIEDRVSALVPDTDADALWPHWSRRAAEAGVGSVLSVRLAVADWPLGALNLFAKRRHGFDDDDQGVADILARHASVAVAAASDRTHLRRAIDARKLIGQAQGLLMERFDLDQDQAFAVLRRYSQDNKIKLRDVARLLIDSRSLPDQR